MDLNILAKLQASVSPKSCVAFAMTTVQHLVAALPRRLQAEVAESPLACLASLDARLLPYLDADVLCEVFEQHNATAAQLSKLDALLCKPLLHRTLFAWRDVLAPSAWRSTVAGVLDLCASLDAVGLVNLPRFASQAVRLNGRPFCLRLSCNGLKDDVLYTVLLAAARLRKRLPLLDLSYNKFEDPVPRLACALATGAVRYVNLEATPWACSADRRLSPYADRLVVRVCNNQATLANGRQVVWPFVSLTVYARALLDRHLSVLAKA